MKIGSVFVLTAETSEKTVVGVYVEIETAKRAARLEAWHEHGLAIEAWSENNDVISTVLYDELGQYHVEYNILVLPLIEDWEV